MPREISRLIDRRLTSGEPSSFVDSERGEKWDGKWNGKIGRLGDSMEEQTVF
jgi:hypothetical protein